jgi:hypothetical protein
MDFCFQFEVNFELFKIIFKELKEIKNLFLFQELAKIRTVRFLEVH